MYDNPVQVNHSVDNENTMLKAAVSTFNRFDVLASESSSSEVLHINASQETPRQSDRFHQVLIVGNSHIRNLRTERFLWKCDNRKLVAYTIKEASDRVLSLEDNFDCICVHAFSNDIRSMPRHTYINNLENFVDALRKKWPAAKILLSTGFARKNDPQINLNMYASNIEVLYRFYDGDQVTVCDNSGLSARANPISKFLRDDVHLSTEGNNIFASNIKSSIRRCLGLERPIEHNKDVTESPKHPSKPFREDTYRRMTNQDNYRPLSRYNGRHYQTNRNDYQDSYGQSRRFAGPENGQPYRNRDYNSSVRVHDDYYQPSYNDQHFEQEKFRNDFRKNYNVRPKFKPSGGPHRF